MPRISPSKVKKFDIYGNDDTDVSLSFGERIRKRFKAHENVQVQNIDDELLEWQYMPEYAEKYGLTDEGTKYVERDDPELWSLEPGETDVMIGACAYLMIEALYKKVVIKRVGIVEHPTSPKQIKNFNFKDAIRAEQLIDQIYLGKVTPSFNQLQPNKIAPKKPYVPPAKKQPKVEEDLDGEDSFGTQTPQLAS